MTPDYERTSYYAHERKEVFAERLLDNMHSTDGWSIRGDLGGAESESDDRGATYGSFSKETRDGRDVLRLVSPIISDTPSSTLGRGWGVSTLYREVNGEDWRGFNRIAFDVYPDLPGFRVVSLCIYLCNDGETRLPNDNVREGLHFVILKNHEWNHVFWEIPELSRDRVTGIAFQYRLQGAEPGACRTVTYDFADLRLQSVDPDHTKGWLPKSGEILFSHVGYSPDSRKTAIASGLDADGFRVLREDGAVAFEGAVETVETRFGIYQTLDFSGLSSEGCYRIEAGGKVTKPFEIRADIWRGTVEKVLNFFYAERCGYPVPGIHDICHADLCARHGDKIKSMNGGWHDAGDLSQGLVNTAEAAYAMMSLAERLDDDDPLREELLDEARWGEDWVLKTRFEDGCRASWLTMDFWTDGVLGTLDDVTFDATRRPFDNFVAAASEALAARVYRESDPPFAMRNLDAAVEDFDFAEEDFASAPQRQELLLASQAALAAAELCRSTGDERYTAKLAGYADIVTACQQTELPDWDVPLRGFFYTDRSHGSIQHFPHRSHEQASLIALKHALELLPEHQNAAKWRHSLKLYAEYVKKIVEFTAPYYMLPASAYSLDETNFGMLGDVPPEHAEAQIKNGVRLSERHYLRMFPVWYTFRGNSGVMLSFARGVLACAEVLGDRELVEIVRRQLEWHVGRNPFGQSLIWGEGYGSTPQYSAMSGDIVGSFPVGVEAQGDEDVPYYPDANCYNYKEVWVHPASRWLWLMEGLEGLS